MSASNLTKKTYRVFRDATAELLRRLPISSEFLGPPKGEYQSFDELLRCEAGAGAREQILFPPERVVLQPMEGVFGPPLEPLDWESYESNPGVIFDCPGARIFNRPHAIISPDDRLFVFASSWYSPRVRSHFAFHQLTLGKLHHVRGRTLYFGGESNVYHFYLDALRQLCVLERAGRSLAEFDHVIARTPTSAVERRFYDALGLSNKKLIDPSAHQHLKCEHLTFFNSGSWRHGLWEPLLLRSLIFGATQIDPKPRGARRLYVSRSRASFRRATNESELTEWLITRGFEVLHLETLTPDEQITAFRDAEIVIGVHGAGLTNVLFCPPGATLIELRNPAFRPESGAADNHRIMAGVIGLRYFAVTTLNLTDPEDVHNSDMHFDLADLQKAAIAAER